MQQTNNDPMRYVIRCQGFANGSYCPHLGWYLESFTHEAGNGRGFGKFTPHLRKALVFEDYDKAVEFYLRPSTTNPIRPDGETNRPMTCMHAEFIPGHMFGARSIESWSSARAGRQGASGGEMTKREQMRYVSRIPRKMQRGILCHNDERHTVDMPPGLNGFRAWFGDAPPNAQFKPCGCGWSGLPHFSSTPDYKCETWDEITPEIIWCSICKGILADCNCGDAEPT
jgi:hypothetical protein